MATRSPTQYYMINLNGIEGLAIISQKLPTTAAKAGNQTRTTTRISYDIAHGRGSPRSRVIFDNSTARDTPSLRRVSSLGRSPVMIASSRIRRKRYELCALRLALHFHSRPD
jgi:hypothetical protein